MKDLWFSLYHLTKDSKSIFLKIAFSEYWTGAWIKVLCLRESHCRMYGVWNYAKPWLAVLMFFLLAIPAVQIIGQTWIRPQRMKDIPEFDVIDESIHAGDGWTETCRVIDEFYKEEKEEELLNRRLELIDLRLKRCSLLLSRAACLLLTAGSVVFAGMIVQSIYWCEVILWSYLHGWVLFFIMLYVNGEGRSLAVKLCRYEKEKIREYRKDRLGRIIL